MPRGLATPSLREEHLVPIRPFLKDAAFGPDAIVAMSATLEEVCKVLEASGRSDVSREAIATTIIALARGGETDPVVLREKTLSELGLSPGKP